MTWREEGVDAYCTLVVGLARKCAGYLRLFCFFFFSHSNWWLVLIIVAEKRGDGDDEVGSKEKKEASTTPNSQGLILFTIF